MKNGFLDCLEPNVKSVLRQIIDEKRCTGNGIMIGRKGELVFEAYDGYADLEKTRKIDKDTVYRMYSMTKVVVSVAVMQLFEKNKFRMSDPLYMYIPEYKEMMIEDVNGLRKAENPILIKHLLTMTSGITYGDGFGRYEEFAENWKAEIEKGNRWTTLEVAKRFASLPLASEPGDKFCYSFGFDILGALVEVLSGMSFPEYCKENIFKPLKMNNTGFCYDDIDKSKLCNAYRRLENGGFEETNGIANPIIDNGLDFETATFASGGAGLLSTIGDYYKFIRMLALGGTADGVRILSKKTVEYIHTPHLTESQRREFAGGDPVCFGEAFSYGFGVRTLIKPHTETLSSIGEWGWAGAMGTWMHIDPKEELFYVYVHQAVPTDHIGYVPYLDTAIYSALE